MRMLVCYDGSESAQSALEKSVAMFKCEKPEIILVSVAEEPADASSNVDTAFENLCTQMEADLKGAAEGLSKQGYNVDAIMAVGDPRKMLVEAVGKKKPDMVVIASRPPEGGIRFGKVSVSVSDYIVRHVTDCPVLVMR